MTERPTLVDGRLIWQLHATHGFPLEFSLPFLADRNILPTWDRFFSAAQADGADVYRLKHRVMEAVSEAYPCSIVDGVRAGLQEMIR